MTIYKAEKIVRQKYKLTFPSKNPIDQFLKMVKHEICIMEAQPTNLEKLCDAFMSVWTRISEECFQQLNICHEELRQFCRYNRIQSSTRNWVTNKTTGERITAT